jgi:hypothetical protein
VKQTGRRRKMTAKKDFLTGRRENIEQQQKKARQKNRNRYNDV